MPSDVWALDHSVRRCLIRDTRDGDSPHVRNSSRYITVVPLNGTKPTVMAPRCVLFPDDREDTDGYASAGLNAIPIGAAARERGG